MCIRIRVYTYIYIYIHTVVWALIHSFTAPLAREADQ